MTALHLLPCLRWCAMVCVSHRTWTRQRVSSGKWRRPERHRNHQQHSAVVLVVYDNKRQPQLEGDVQDVYFTSMAFDAAGKLLIENERGERYSVDVEQRKVTRLP